MRKTEGFQPLFLKINIKTNERYCIFYNTPRFFIRLCLNATASLVQYKHNTIHLKWIESCAYFCYNESAMV